MSRIHEALKKAELQRMGGETVDAAPRPPVPVATAATATEEKVPAPTVRLDTSVAVATVPSAASESIRFEDLWAGCAHPKWDLDPKESVFSPALGVRAAEQFRTLRSRLYQLRPDGPPRILLVTSSLVGEGKTFVTSNLAQAIVHQPHRRCLIIDADLRCSRLHVPLGALSAPGLTDYLSGDADELTVIQHGHEGNLFFIPGGKPVSNPSELLSNGRLQMLLDRVAPAFDWVIFDSPPCLPVADASVLADLCESVLLVVKARSTPLAVVQRALQQLRSTHVAGVVLNTVEEKALGYASYYASRYYLQDPAKEPAK